MSSHFAKEEWARVFATLDAATDENYGIPVRRDDSAILGSWNIRKFGAPSEKGVAKRSPGAWDLIERFARSCDLLAVQEVQRDLGSIVELVARLNRAGAADYAYVASDPTGKAPGAEGMPERFAFIYRTDRFALGNIVSDITFDQSAVVEKVNAALAKIRAEIRVATGSTVSKTLDWLSEFTGFDRSDLPAMFDFVRSPHCAVFRLLGKEGHFMDLACVNAHLISGTRKDREREFFALLQWLLVAIAESHFHEATAGVLLADLNLDFEDSNDARKAVIEEYLVQLNAQKRACAVNFPFLDKHPEKKVFKTNSREKETYDHIAFFSKDIRLPRGRHNGLAGKVAGEFDYGMFDFLRLFRDAGVHGSGAGEQFGKFEHDLSDHMPIWIRLAIPRPGQPTYEVTAPD